MMHAHFQFHQVCDFSESFKHVFDGCKTHLFGEAKGNGWHIWILQQISHKEICLECAGMLTCVSPSISLVFCSFPNLSEVFPLPNYPLFKI